MSVIDHTGVNVADFNASVAFYEKALAPLGISVVKRNPKEAMDGAPQAQAVGMGRNQMPSFWVGSGPDATIGGSSVHIAFVAQSRAEVDGFYHAAIAAGGKDNGRPGPRPEYHPGYYGAFVYDLDGHNIEAVTHRPE